MSSAAPGPPRVAMAQPPPSPGAQAWGTWLADWQLEPSGQVSLSGSQGVMQMRRSHTFE